MSKGSHNEHPGALAPALPARLWSLQPAFPLPQFTDCRLPPFDRLARSTWSIQGLSFKENRSQWAISLRSRWSSPEVRASKRLCTLALSSSVRAWTNATFHSCAGGSQLFANSDGSFRRSLVETSEDRADLARSARLAKQRSDEELNIPNWTPVTPSRKSVKQSTNPA